jgi:hypothetical protein
MNDDHYRTLNSFDRDFFERVVIVVVLDCIGLWVVLIFYR